MSLNTIKNYKPALSAVKIDYYLVISVEYAKTYVDVFL